MRQRKCFAGIARLYTYCSSLRQQGLDRTRLDFLPEFFSKARAARDDENGSYRWQLGVGVDSPDASDEAVSQILPSAHNMHPAS